MKEFDNIIGYDAIKLELMRICDILVNPEKYAKLGVNIQNGLMLHGNPGVGKTLFANCFLKACKRKQYICRKDKPNGEFINHIKDVFEKASWNSIKLKGKRKNKTPYDYDIRIKIKYVYNVEKD